MRLSRLACLSAVLFCLSALPAFAQLEPGTTSGTLAFFAASAADPNVATPVAPPVDYVAAVITCGLAKPSPLAGIVNPTTAWMDDPSDATKACRFTITAQVRGLSFASLKGSLRMNAGANSSGYGPFSNPFDRRLLTPAGLLIQ